MEYLKNLILQLYTTGEAEALLPVFTRLLSLGPDDVKRCKQVCVVCGLGWGDTMQGRQHCMPALWCVHQIAPQSVMFSAPHIVVTVAHIIIINCCSQLQTTKLNCSDPPCVCLTSVHSRVHPHHFRVLFACAPAFVCIKNVHCCCYCSGPGAPGLWQRATARSCSSSGHCQQHVQWVGFVAGDAGNSRAPKWEPAG